MIALGCVWIARHPSCEREQCSQKAGCKLSVMVKGSLPFVEDELSEQSRVLVLETLVMTMKQHVDSGNRNEKTNKQTKSESKDQIHSNEECGFGYLRIFYLNLSFLTFQKGDFGQVV